MKIIFLDRDGVINKFPGLGNYVTRVKDFHFIPGSLTAIRQLTGMGYAIFIVSNQAGVSRGVYSQKKLDQITKHMMTDVKKSGGKITKVFYCTHTQHHNCDCRKPKIGSIKEAMSLVNKTLKHAQKSFFVGDTNTDIEAGNNAGCRTILVLSGKDNRRATRTWKVKPDFVAQNLLEAVKIVCHEDSCLSCHSGRRA